VPEVTLGELEFCDVERDGRLLIVTIRRPEVMNALHPPANQELSRVFDEFEQDPELWIGIVTGAGERAFSAGNDLKFQAAGNRVTTPSGGFGGITSRFTLDKPLIAAVNGVAMGGGFEIALACDVIIAAENATFALPEPRVGLAALAGGIHRLPRKIGLSRALPLMLTGRRFGAREALEWGVAAEVVPTGEALKGARRWAEEMLQCSPMSLRATKQSALSGLDDGLRAAMERSYPAVQALVRSEDFREGPRAFAEKRPPQWKGR
jgi:enoyl-CoA hydratase/carnithine racemase